MLHQNSPRLFSQMLTTQGTEAKHSQLYWLVIGRAGRLFLPLASQQVQEYCLRFFLGKRWQRFTSLVYLVIGYWFGLVGFLPKVSSDDIDALFSGTLSSVRLLCPDTFPHFAFQIGSYGPFQKISVLALSDDCNSHVYIKFALRESADRAISNEVNWLKYMEAFPTLKDSVPALLGFGHLSSGRPYLITSVSSVMETVTDFTVQHEQFLMELGHATQVYQTYGDSDEVTSINELLSKLQVILGSEVYDDLAAGWEDVLNNLASWQGPLVLVHGDFIPWNIRLNQQSINVFDWEYAALGANPLHDFFHFYLMQYALSRRKWNTPVIQASLLKNARKYALKAYPQSRWDDDVVDALLLVYLVNTVLFYTDSGQLFDPEHPVLSTYLSLIQSRRRWLRT